MKRSLFGGRFPQIQTLESRRLLAADIVLNGRDVVATGTDGNDTMRIERVGTDDVLITVNGSLTRRLDMDDVDSYLLEGLAGNDSITKVGTIPDVTLRGGAGIEDVLRGRDATFEDGERVLNPAGQLAVEFDFADGVNIFGTTGNDVLTLTNREGKPHIQINSSFAGVVTFSNSAFYNPLARGGTSEGNDRIIIGQDFPIAVQAFGGNGADFFDIGTGTSVAFFGGDGDDTILPRGGPNDVEANGKPIQITGNGVSSGGAGTDTFQLDQQTLFSLGEFFDVENVTNAQGTVIGNVQNNRITVRSTNTAGITVEGRDGDDTIIGGPGPDKFFGEEGDDTLTGNGGSDLLDGGEGIDSLSGGAGTNTLLNGENNNVPQFFFDGFDLVAYGTLGNDTMSVVRTGVDDVRITVNGVSRTFDMDDFEQIILYGGPGADTMSAGAGVEEVFFFGRRGNDQITGNELLNRLVGGDGDDTLNGNAGDDYFDAGAGNDTLNGGPGDDALNAGEGNDTLTGGPGNDEFDGNSGDDTLFARDGLNEAPVNGGEGFDRAQVDPGDSLVGIDQVLP